MLHQQNEMKREMRIRENNTTDTTYKLETDTNQHQHNTTQQIQYIS